MRPSINPHMRFEYALDENDYLTYQLYSASQSRNIKSARLRSWVIITVAFLVMGFVGYANDYGSMATGFFILSGLSLVLYPLFSRWQYRRHFLKHIRENRKNQLGVTSALQFTDEGIELKDKTGEGKILKTELEAIIELQGYFLLKLRSGMSLVIPKNKIDLPALEGELQSISANWGVPLIQKLNWKWR